MSLARTLGSALYRRRDSQHPCLSQSSNVQFNINFFLSALSIDFREKYIEISHDVCRFVYFSINFALYILKLCY